LNFSNANTRFFSPTANLFADIVAPGPDNFNDADGRSLYVPDYLIVNNNLAFNNPQAVIDAINAGILASNALNGVDYPTFAEPTSQLSAFFDISEKTSALYLQGNFDFQLGSFPFRGNLGVRYVKTDIKSIGNNVSNGEVEETQTSGSYDFWLPRVNIVMEATENLLFRFGAGEDIRRPNFDQLSTSVAFPGGASVPVRVGNPELEPETVWSYDLSGEYYFSPSAFLAVGLFYKERTNLFGVEIENPVEPTGPDGQIERDITPPCEEGGIYNPVADRNVWSSQTGIGICVPLSTFFNVSGDTTQKGIEIAFQYDLSAYEDSLGWASGFGIIANYTHQEQDSSSDEFRTASGDANALNKLLGRFDTDMSTPTLDDDVVQERIYLTDLSEDAYNLTLFYDKYGWSFRARYTWRSEYYTNDLVSFDLPRIVDDRAQLNASLSYMFNETWTVGVEGINLLREDATQWCVNKGALLCSQGLTDRRIIAGVTANF
jgi:TonB-dependent receptor